MLQGHPRENPFDLEKLNAYADYWETVRTYYYPLRPNPVEYGGHLHR